MRRAVLLVLLGVLTPLLGVGPAAADEGPWGWPLAGEPAVVRDVDPPAVRWAAGHRGIDLAGSPGATVLAAGAGRVSWAGLLAGRGVVVVVHGALRTTYEPVTAAVAVGEQVALGQPLGVLEPGHLGCEQAACLHWGLRRGEEYLDPLRLVERGPVRLLPVPGAGAGAVPGAAGGAPGAAGPLVRAPAPARPLEAELCAPTPAESAPPEAEPAFSLRAAEAPLGAAALAALAVGIGLLARPRPQPPAPVSGGMAGRAVPVETGPAGPPGELLDLEAARLRRRAG